MDDKVIATGLYRWGLGNWYSEKMTEKEIEHKFFEISGETRNCIAILHEGMQSEILESGPSVTSSESENFLKHFEELVKKVKLISISGSFPSGMEDDYYARW